MRLREKPLIPWIFAEENGKINFGHCNCMAGLGESCSHVRSLLWAIQAGVRMRERKKKHTGSLHLESRKSNALKLKI